MLLTNLSNYFNGKRSRANELFLLAMLLMLAAVYYSPGGNSFSITFGSIILEGFSFILIGSLISGLLEVFVSKDRLVGFLPRNKSLAVYLAAALGLLFPVCECAIVPVVRRLLKKGFPLGAGIGFLLGGPIVNSLVIGSTAVAYKFNWSVVGLRVGLGYLIAVAAGLIIDYLKNNDSRLDLAGSTGGPACHHHHHGEGWLNKLRQALGHGAHDFVNVAGYFIMGAFLAALFQTFIARQQLMEIILSVPALAIIMMMVLAFLLNLCSEADAFVAASFQSTGLPLTAQLAFMILGPMLDAKLVAMYSSVFNKRMIITLVTITLSLVLLAMVILEVFL